ncbi:uncharacterized protein CELE_Y37E11AL.12 [Caenorhabditis elegans]|uniref:Uncharacterized protein n=1 Tax=Caenorhabditis elegans TaxID=6239 RepID=D3KZG6_CAEEL|nr:Uncharacterized protein CELE_Y37E11AL.12 [Caenorhabditis elegans]CCD68236.1 Uncharacterized protein CELE_Y37E11AL.12 [Caenorhabditis elegans]|eukprot:NP_001255252.1 Uncharacterized protein CELE_Y37E11AL.12 [Caenorhabditis elegans]
MQQGQVNSRELADALNNVKIINEDAPTNSFRFYIFISFLGIIIAYLLALFNRESVCNLLKTDNNDYFSHK